MNTLVNFLSHKPRRTVSAIIIGGYSAGVVGTVAGLLWAGYRAGVKKGVTPV